MKGTKHATWYSRNFPAAEIREVFSEEVMHELGLEYGFNSDKCVLLLQEQKSKVGRWGVGGARR